MSKAYFRPLGLYEPKRKKLNKRDFWSFIVAFFLSVLCLSCGGIRSDPLSDEEISQLTYPERIEIWCTHFVACLPPDTSSISKCIMLFGGMRISDACIQASRKINCKESDQIRSDYRSACWESCTGDWYQCDGDVRYDCFQQDLMVFDCEAKCYYSYSAAYSGHCGRVSPDGENIVDHDICWCNL